MNNLLAEVKEQDQDFEWYPTTEPIIRIIKADIELMLSEHASVLDCGAGDGRVLNGITKGDKYAIEKSKPLLDSLDKEIFIVGTEFKEQTLIDKKVDVVFSNPPYSEYEQWTVKIIKEAHAKYVYLVIPARWVNSELIKDAIETREAKHFSLGSYDFLNAERSARAKVNIVKIKLCSSGYSRDHMEVDPFAVWFNENFKINAREEKTSGYSKSKMNSERIKEASQNALVEGDNLIKTLESLYLNELDTLVTTYQKVGELDVGLLKEMDIDLSTVRGSLQIKISGLKDLYWNELFNNLSKVTDKLTSGSRKTLLDTLTHNTHVDFSAQNAYAVVIWVIKNANGYYDSQLIKMFENMVNKANVQLYKSNKNTFGEERWRYCATPDDLDNFKLDYRIVLHRTGGIYDTSNWSGRAVNGLEERAAIFLDNLCTIASNIGFDTVSMERSSSFEWSSGKKCNFQYRDITDSWNLITLFEAKAFKNGNLHIKFNQKFMQRLNIEFGRLKGWVKSPRQASEEMDIPINEALKGFSSNLKLESSNLLAIGLDCE